jgi:UDP-glucose:(heptosyl)LPS alpha-1,3-glucosyltransferase
MNAGRVGENIRYEYSLLRELQAAPVDGAGIFMRVALGIVSYFATGGLQRDCVRVARRLIEQGHEVTIFTSRTDGSQPLDLKMVVLPNPAITNHGRNAIFARHFQRAASGAFDRIAGFDKLPGLDVLYCADECLARRIVNLGRFFWPRYRALLRLEEACFGRGRPTRIVLLSKEQLASYRIAWDTEPARVTLISPTIDKRRRQPELRDDGTRERVRAEIGATAKDWLWLSIGSYMHTKGMDRTLDALGRFPHARALSLPASSPTADADAPS